VFRNVGIVHHNAALQPEDGGSKVLRNVDILPHVTTWRHNPQDLHLNIHGRENKISFKSDINQRTLLLIASIWAINLRDTHIVPLFL
jgi:hypothetical protein